MKLKILIIFVLIFFGCTLNVGKQNNDIITKTNNYFLNLNNLNSQIVDWRYEKLIARLENISEKEIEKAPTLTLFI